MKKSLSIAEWHQMAMEETAPPVRIQLAGNSMFPLIRRKRDYVTIISPERELIIGDIVMFSEPGSERFVMHRIWELQNGEVLTWGDHSSMPDGWLPAEAIWGRAILIERGKRKIQPDPRKGIRWARFWHQARKVYCPFADRWDGLKRRIKKWRASNCR